MWTKYNVFKDLKVKHPDIGKPKIEAMGRLIDRGRYDDYDNPPQIPLITGSPAPLKKKGENISTALANAATVVAKAFQTSRTPVSPNRHASTKENVEPSSKLSPLKSA